jgi:hypothetical protein
MELKTTRTLHNLKYFLYLQLQLISYNHTTFKTIFINFK